MDQNQCIKLLDTVGIRQVSGITQFHNPEDGEGYDVWRIDTPRKSYVLKRAKGYERETYESFFWKSTAYAPQLIGSREEDGEEYLLLEYVAGHDLMRCSRDSLILALDALAAMQIEWWGNVEKADVGLTFERSLEGRRNRLQYLRDPVLEKAYHAYLDTYSCIPRTLCHDDLLPFNVLVSKDRAVLIDWEYGGILPYLTPLARLIAHADDSEDAFFHMLKEDKEFAVEYYFEKCAEPMGISLNDYQKALDLFLFYEYCEWIYVGNKCGNTDNDRYRKYCRLALEMADKLGYNVSK